RLWPFTRGGPLRVREFMITERFLSHFARTAVCERRFETDDSGPPSPDLSWKECSYAWTVNDSWAGPRSPWKLPSGVPHPGGPPAIGRRSCQRGPRAVAAWTGTGGGQAGALVLGRFCHHGRGGRARAGAVHHSLG